MKDSHKLSEAAVFMFIIFAADLLKLKKNKKKTKTEKVGTKYICRKFNMNETKICHGFSVLDLNVQAEMNFKSFLNVFGAQEIVLRQKWTIKRGWLTAPISSVMFLCISYHSARHRQCIERLKTSPTCNWTTVHLFSQAQIYLYWADMENRPETQAVK